jgi:hypothetical protein
MTTTTKILHPVKFHAMLELWYNARTGNYYIRDWAKEGKTIARCGKSIEKANSYAEANGFEWK